MHRIESKLDSIIQLEGKIDQLMLSLQDGDGKVTVKDEKEFVVGKSVLSTEIIYVANKTDLELSSCFHRSMVSTFKSSS